MDQTEREVRVMPLLIQIATWSAIGVTSLMLCGCFPNGVIITDKPGIQALGDVITGNMVSARMPANIQGPHYALRSQQEIEETARRKSGGLAGLFNSFMTVTP